MDVIGLVVTVGLLIFVGWRVLVEPPLKPDDDPPQRRGYGAWEYEEDDADHT
jgi:hypothetical protein